MSQSCRFPENKWCEKIKLTYQVLTKGRLVLEGVHQLPAGFLLLPVLNLHQFVFLINMKKSYYGNKQKLIVLKS
jgi:hypothetical protein